MNQLDALESQPIEDESMLDKIPLIKTKAIGGTVARPLLNAVASVQRAFSDADPDKLARAALGLDADSKVEGDKLFALVKAEIEKMQSDPRLLGVKSVRLAYSTDNTEEYLKRNDDTLLPADVLGGYHAKSGTALISTATLLGGLKSMQSTVVAEEVIGEALATKLGNIEEYSVRAGKGKDIGAAIGAVVQGESLEEAKIRAEDNNGVLATAYIDGEPVQVRTFFKNIKKFLADRGNDIKGFVGDFWDGLSDVAKTVYNGLSAAGKNVAKELSSIKRLTVDNAVMIADALESSVKVAGTTIYEGVKFVARHLGNFLAEILLRGLISPIVRGVQRTVGRNFRAIKSIVTAVTDDIMGYLSNMANFSSLDRQAFQGESRGDDTVLKSLYLPITATKSVAPLKIDNTGEIILADMLNTPKVASIVRYAAGIFEEHAPTLKTAFIKQVFGDISPDQIKVIENVYREVAEAIADGPISREDAAVLMHKLDLKVGSFGSKGIPAGGLHIPLKGAIAFGDHVLEQTTAATGETESLAQNTVAAIFLEELTHFAATKAGADGSFKPLAYNLADPQGDLGRRAVNFVVESGLPKGDRDQIRIPDAKIVATANGADDVDEFVLPDGTAVEAGFFASAKVSGRIILSVTIGKRTLTRIPPGHGATGGLENAGQKFDPQGVNVGAGLVLSVPLSDAEIIVDSQTGSSGLAARIGKAIRGGAFVAEVSANVGVQSEGGKATWVVWEPKFLYTNDGNWSSSGTHVVTGQVATAIVINSSLFGLNALGFGTWMGLGAVGISGQLVIKNQEVIGGSGSLFGVGILDVNLIKKGYASKSVDIFHLMTEKLDARVAARGITVNQVGFRLGVSHDNFFDGFVPGSSI